MARCTVVLRRLACRGCFWWLTGLVVLAWAVSLACAEPLGEEKAAAQPPEQRYQQRLLDYYHQMSVPKPFVVRKGEDFEAHRQRLRQKVLESTGLSPLPARIPLDVHQSPPLDHPWCTVRRVYYQLWPGVYSSGLLFMPKHLAERPAPAVLNPHGHWEHGNAHPEVQKRCLNFARLGYVTFSSTQNHYEDLYVGVSHQTLMIWNNLRALDYLESLPEVDRTRIGVAGASGGGLQTQMVVALDPRVKAATIVGLTCDFRQIMFPDRCHCTCNHFPGVMRFTDHPEISALGLPAAVQYLTMNDWTKTFQHDNFPTIQALYAANGAADRLACKYFDTPHNYDQEKREYTYGWMERWVRGKGDGGPVSEPPTQTFPVETLTGLKADVPGDKGFGEIGRIYRRQRGYPVPAIADRAEWRTYHQQMQARLRDLLGENAALPRKESQPKVVSARVEGKLAIDQIDCPSEGPIVVPTLVLRPEGVKSKMPVVVLLSSERKSAPEANIEPELAAELAGRGALVAVPDVRFLGRLACPKDKDPSLWHKAWERNGIVWGRPVPAMTATDLRAVLDALATRPDADMGHVLVMARGAGDTGIAALFAAALDPRISAVDVELAGSCFEKRNLPLVSCVLQHGDVLQWAALAADRKVVLRGLPAEAGDPGWLRGVFAAVGNPDGLRTEPR